MEAQRKTAELRRRFAQNGNRARAHGSVNKCKRQDGTSVQGNCSDPDPATALGLRGAATASLLPVQSYQCLILISHTWLVVNSGTLWLDNLYLKLLRTTAQPRFAFVHVGAPDPKPARAVPHPARVFATNVTFQADSRAGGRAVRSAAAVATNIAHSAVMLDGATLPCHILMICRQRTLAFA